MLKRSCVDKRCAERRADGRASSGGGAAACANEEARRARYPREPPSSRVFRATGSKTLVGLDMARCALTKRSRGPDVASIAHTQRRPEAPRALHRALWAPRGI